MRSSTSSSNDRLPSGPWLRTWLLAAALYLAVMAGWEAFWRARGWWPTVVADQEAWVLARLRVQPASTVLIGTSRMGAALDPEVWREAEGGPAPVMLAIEGGAALPVLKDLAADSSFRGTAVAEMMPLANFGTAQPVSPYLAAAHEARVSPAKRWEAHLRLNVSSHLVFRRMELQPARLVRFAYLGASNRPAHFSLRKDQYRPIDFRIDNLAPNTPQVLDSASFRYMRRWGTPLAGPALEARLADIAHDVTRLQARGGRVVFLFLRGCGGRKQMEEALYPAARYWEPLARLPGVQAIDSDSVPALAHLPCYDGSHVDVRDAAAVTRAVAALVRPAP